MKHIQGLGLVTHKISLNFMLLGLCLLPQMSKATTQFQASCPDKFIATVTNVEDVPTGLFPKVEVNFQVIQTLKGVEQATKKIQIVKDGPVQFKSGEIYTVELRENWLCSATLFSKL